MRKSLLSRNEHLRRIVKTDNFVATLVKSLRERTIAAPEIEDACRRRNIEKFEDFLSIVMHKREIVLVALLIPSDVHTLSLIHI